MMAGTHEAVKEFARKLADEGHDPNDVIDSLVTVGLNAALRVSGKDVVLTYLDKLAGMVRDDKPVSTARH